MTRRVLAVRLDSDGDVLLTGPAITALGTDADGAPAEVDLLASPAGAAAARLLPGVSDVLVAAVPWSGYRPAAPDPAALAELVARVAAGRYDECVIFTSYHQSPLPMALVARMAGIDAVAGTSEDYPGSLLDVRFRRASAPDGSGGGHEVLAALALVAATGRAVPDDPLLAVRRPLAQLPAALCPLIAEGAGRTVVVHPGASVPARAPAPSVAGAIAAALVARGWSVLVTGGPSEGELTAQVAAAAPGAHDIGGATSLAELAALLAAATAVVVGNTGPAHLAAAVGTPVVSLFSPVMPPERWAPWGVPAVLLGDASAACRMSRARECPVPGHPCLDVAPLDVVAAVGELAAGAVVPLRGPQSQVLATTGPGL